ncbi:MAG: hypothetical protein KY454_12710 [Actinobacteria bacterium]|nr:hypothetical protein [Actinomycetota bacterium]
MRGSTRRGASPPSRLGILGFGSGLALVASILSGISLAATLLVVVVAGTLAARSLWARTTTERRALARRRLHAGAVAGIAALGAYDLSRWVLVAVLGFRFGPFDAFGGFGRALWGAGAQGWWVEATGVAIHLANGLGFALGYTLLVRRPGPASGIVFALGLEAAMVALYPHWLRIQAVDEFLQVSMVGHLAYGATLGWVSRAVLERRDTGAPAPAVDG